MPKRDMTTPTPLVTSRQEAAQARKEKKAEQTKQLNKVQTKLQKELAARGVETEVLSDVE
jgi:cysteine sulfinate desulfinase/cysteine desulfurase-like protein